MRAIIQAILASIALASGLVHAAPNPEVIELQPIVITAEAPSDATTEAPSSEDALQEESLSKVVEAQVSVDSTHE
ncbi:MULTISPECIES: hypothetical protein [Pseudomonas syringae group genomosp. 2]|uniref:Uncharacterized protein n=2 Tax=Pseudomonas amygdali pv. lachrymans TaxID=53707 RepID=A0ABR5KS57_PSEAV|nr:MULTISPECIES: hypothetical protein [Pseudomonas syringae group genomosp. 2]AXH60133.1 hypothetical protein PLA107_033530 [Pseudomonas amygdali pv. lachrymans str. M301315]KPC17537.1 Uncharacterized protein AC499_0739 [Pseudomonas amygdali pv. lachrymans]RMT06429.1 hypothetical protein ALP54_03977 [Pseudomonas amygdali pv. lachrymans]RMV37131.1 hypothetical protein ALP12_200484 [Pseudomonas savastanoi pv. phaseolicola]